MNTDTNTINEHSRTLDGFDERLDFRVWEDGTAEARLVDTGTGETVWVQTTEWQTVSEAETWCYGTWAQRRGFLLFLRKNGKA